MSALDQSWRDSAEYRRVRAVAMMRGGRCCRDCGRVGDDNEVDHIIPASEAPELRMCLLNLQVLCPDCHRKKHGGCAA